MYYLEVFLIAVLLSSCTLSINMTDTHGRARDVGEESTQQTPTVEAEIPIKV
jgi:hypothetical protein